MGRGRGSILPGLGGGVAGRLGGCVFWWMSEGMISGPELPGGEQ